MNRQPKRFWRGAATGVVAMAMALVAIGTGFRNLSPSAMTSVAAAVPDGHDDIDELSALGVDEQETQAADDAGGDEADCQVGKAKGGRAHPFPKSRPAPEFPKDTPWLNVSKPVRLKDLPAECG